MALGDRLIAYRTFRTAHSVASLPRVSTEKLSRARSGSGKTRRAEIPLRLNSARKGSARSSSHAAISALTRIAIGVPGAAAAAFSTWRKAFSAIADTD